jgi:hypothetical protein
MFQQKHINCNINKRQDIHDHSNYQRNVTATDVLLIMLSATISEEPSNSWETNSRSASQEIPGFL